MPEQLPPNIENAYRSELAGLVARLDALDDTPPVLVDPNADLRADLEERIAAIRGLLGEVNGVPKKGRRVTRPQVDPAIETTADGGAPTEG